MPKGRGANARRQSGRQHRPKDKRDAQDAGAAKQFDLLIRAEEVEKKRRAQSPVAQAVAKRRQASEKKRAARRKRRAKWAT